MNVALRQPMTVDQFLEWEERQELRYEFNGVSARAMVGGTVAHSLIQVNLTSALLNRLRGTACRPYGSSLKIIVGSGSIRYADAFVTLSRVAPDAMWVTDPYIVFEVLGDGADYDDLFVENAEYRATPSIQRYVILQQTLASAAVFVRKADDWVADFIFGNEAFLRIPEIGVDISLAEIYADVAFTTDEADDEL